MTWSRFDDAAALGPKANAAGNEAWGLWTAAIEYSNRHLTDGFVTISALATKCLPIPISEAKAKALAEKLVGAVVRPNGKGLFERADGGYLIHDFLDWNPSKAEVELKRKIDRDRKKKGGDSGGGPDGTEHGSRTDSERKPSGGRRDSEAPRASARVPAPAARPVPSQPDHSGSDPAAANSDDIAARAQRVLDNPHDGRYSRPSTWPEVQAVAKAWWFGRPEDLKLRDDANRDSDLRAVLDALAADITVADCELAGAAARTDAYFLSLKNPGPSAFTAAVLRTLITKARKEPEPTAKPPQMHPKAQARLDAARRQIADENAARAAQLGVNGDATARDVEKLTEGIGG